MDNQPINTQIHPEHKRLFYLVSILVVLTIVLTIALAIQIQRTFQYQFDAKMGSFRAIPLPTRRLTTPTITPEPINSAKGLENALGELENVNVNATNVIQTHLNEFTTESSQ